MSSCTCEECRVRYYNSPAHLGTSAPVGHYPHLCHETNGGGPPEPGQTTFHRPRSPFKSTGYHPQSNHHYSQPPPYYPISVPSTTIPPANAYIPQSSSDQYSPSFNYSPPPPPSYTQTNIYHHQCNSNDMKYPTYTDTSIDVGYDAGYRTGASIGTGVGAVTGAVLGTTVGVVGAGIGGVATVAEAGVRGVAGVAGAAVNGVAGVFGAIGRGISGATLAKLKIFGDLLHRDGSGDSREEPEPEPSPSRMQWVKERLAYAGTSILGINGVQNGTGSPSIGHRTPLSGSRAFSRNDSSNSNTSGSQYSGTAGDYNGYPFTPPRTPPPPKTPPPTCRTPTPSTPAKNGTNGAAKESTTNGGSYFTFNSPISTRAAAPPTRFAHLKLTPKSSGTGSLGTPVSLNGSLHNNNNTSTTSSANSSLRRQRFRQNHNSRFESRRRLSKTSSTGTSCGSQEHSLAASTSLLANPIVDRLLDYVRENYVKTMDPFNWDINRKFRLTSFASFRVESGIISGVGNFERLSDSKLTKSMDELTQIVLSSHIVFSDLLAEFRFSARIAKIPMHGKTLRIFLEKAIVYVEISIDHTMTAKVRMLRLISMDGLECKTRGIAFPLNKSLDSFASKTLHNAASRSDQYVEQCIVPLINRACDNCFESALKSMSITDLFW